MEMTNDEARAEYLDLLSKQISPEMRAAVPRVMDIMTSPAALETFSPSSWNGLKVPAINFDTAPGMPTSMRVKSRPIRKGIVCPRKERIRSPDAILLRVGSREVYLRNCIPVGHSPQGYRTVYSDLRRLPGGQRVYNDPEAPDSDCSARANQSRSIQGLCRS